MTVVYSFLIISKAAGNVVTFAIFGGTGCFCFAYLAIFLRESSNV